MISITLGFDFLCSLLRCSSTCTLVSKAYGDMPLKREDFSAFDSSLGYILRPKLWSDPKVGSISGKFAHKKSITASIFSKICLNTPLQGAKTLECENSKFYWDFTPKKSDSLGHKSENVHNLSDILIRDHDVRTYFTGPHKILHFAGSGHRRILELWGGNLLSRDP